MKIQDENSKTVTLASVSRAWVRKVLIKPLDQYLSYQIGTAGMIKYESYERLKPFHADFYDGDGIMNERANIRTD